MNILWQKNEMGEKTYQNTVMTEEATKKARDFHQSFPLYEKTPLLSLGSLAKKLGVAGIYVKDESKRFGLNAFKVLGASYAMGQYIAETLGEDIESLPYQRLISKEISEKMGEVTFFTATDGNHGRGVAWAANQLGQHSVVYMPAGSASYRLEKIREEGATASIENMNYDDAVRLADKNAKKVANGVVVQDTAWEGYEKIPAWIMQGYGTMAWEADTELESLGILPTHIFVQAGVGSLAGAVQGYFAEKYGENCPNTSIIEPHAANCHYKSAVAKSYQTVGGDLQTLMAGLACGEPNTISWEILKSWSDMFISCPDEVAALGMKLAAKPEGEDTPFVSGESGAVPLGFLWTVMKEEHLLNLRDALGLNEHSHILLFSTEGDTDPETYQRIVGNPQ